MTLQKLKVEFVNRSRSREAGLPDGLFYDPKSPSEYILEGLGRENVGICWYVWTKKNLATLSRSGLTFEKLDFILFLF
jgi:hypothetical protein